MSAPDQRSEQAIEAFNQGYQDFEESFERWQCPYDSDERELAEQWIEGWDAAEADYFHEAQRNDYDQVLDDPRHGQAEGINRGR